MLNILRCHAFFKFSANLITRSRLLIQIPILNDKQCRSRSVGFLSFGFFKSQLIWLYIVCKDRVHVYQGSEGQELISFDYFFLQTVPRWFPCCSTFLFVDWWVDMWRLFCHCLVFISSSLGASGSCSLLLCHFLSFFIYIGCFCRRYPNKFSNADQLPKPSAKPMYYIILRTANLFAACTQPTKSVYYRTTARTSII